MIKSKSQNYSYNKNNGSGNYNTAPFHYDESTGILTFDGGGELAKTDYNSNWWKLIGNNVTKIVFKDFVDAPKDSSFLFAASSYALGNENHMYYDKLLRFEGLEYLDVSRVKTMDSIFDSQIDNNKKRDLNPKFLYQVEGWNVKSVNSFKRTFASNSLSDVNPLINWLK